MLPWPVDLDVRSWLSVEAGAALVEATLGPVDALVNNAGISRVARAQELPRDWGDVVVDVNLNGTWRCVQTFGRLMVTRGRGAIVNIGSAYSEIGAPGRVAYAATKTGIVGVTRVLGVEWAGRGVRVNAIEPGYTDTPMMQVTLETGSLDTSRLVDRIPAGRLGDPNDVAQAVAFLLSDAAGYITSASLRIDGGHLAYGGIPSASSLPAPMGRADG